ncbi:MAG: methylmalonyl Co-A mutase-associated GTPase MeaB [Bacteroidota bacterium]
MPNSDHPSDPAKGKKGPALNPQLSSRFKRKRSALPSVDELWEGVRAGDRMLLSRAITLVESTRPDHRQQANELVKRCLPFSGHSVRIGITGTPGVGKSTFIEALGQYVLAQDRKLAVLAIDPSSSRSGGSILGDKTRMTILSANPAVFIRPSPAGESLGGVAQKTRETMLLCEAAGFDTLFVETVGVGQSETAVHAMVDFFLLLLLPGAGDELQGIKRGIVEMADLLAVNKSDGDRIKLAKLAKREYRNALHLMPMRESNWTPKVLLCSALTQSGIDEIWDSVKKYLELTKRNGFFERRRKEQALYWLEEGIREGLQQLFFENQTLAAEFAKVKQGILHQEISSYQGAEHLLKLFRELK